MVLRAEEDEASVVASLADHEDATDGHLCEEFCGAGQREGLGCGLRVEARVLKRVVSHMGSYAAKSDARQAAPYGVWRIAFAGRPWSGGFPFDGWVAADAGDVRQVNEERDPVGWWFAANAERCRADAVKLWCEQACLGCGDVADFSCGVPDGDGVVVMSVPWFAHEPVRARRRSGGAGPARRRRCP
jgi:hypothetical protein